MNYWNALAVVRQITGELGLPVPASLVGTDDQSTTQMVALLNSAGNELLLYYPWEQFTEFWNLSTSDGLDKYDLPDDWAYFKDQTQWDKTNSWPLLGPKSAQEWSWITNGGIASAPSTRYRVFQDKLVLFPVPGATPCDLAMEYIRRNWVLRTDSTETDMVVADSDLVQYHPWMMVKFIKLKFYELKGFDTTAVQGDFSRIFLALVG